MKLSRLVAFLAVPAALSLAACGGGSTSTFVNNATSGAAQVRFVQGDPKVGALDIYFFQSSGSPTTTPAQPNLPYGEASDFQAQTAVPNTLVARAAGSGSSGAAVTACNLPAMTNVNYSIVIADQNGAPNCMVFQDSNYGGTAQYRVHHAAADAVAANASLGTIAYGVGTSAAAFTVQGPSTLGGFVGSSNPVTLSGSTGNQANATGTVFGIGANASVGTSEAPLASVPATSVFAPTTFTQPDTAGTLPFSTYVGISVYAIDCTTAIAGTTTPIPCTGGQALIGVFDTK